MLGGLSSGISPPVLETNGGASPMKPDLAVGASKISKFMVPDS